jgi:uncharacterized protein (TIGR03435 family)
MLCAQQPPARPAFDVASVKLYKDDGGPRNSRSYTPRGVTFGGCTLGYIIGEAYDVPAGRLQGPGSLTKEALWAPLRQGYDIAGRSGHAASKEEIRMMLQSLLADRFGLTLHQETKTERVYRLVVAKDGPKLEESPETNGNFGFSGSPNGYAFHNAEMMRLSGFLSGQVDRVVVDQTGLKGVYNFVLKMPEDLRPDSPKKSEGSSPDSLTGGSFAGALKTLRLQLIAGTAPVDYLVVDHVEPPTEN